MAINTGKVITAGLAAGLVMNVCDFVFNTYIMADAFKTDLDALNPALMTNMESAGMSLLVKFVILDFIFGILLVWTYAAIRPRFGPGVVTAMRAGLLIWAVSGLTMAFVAVMGIFSMGFYITSFALSLITMLASAWVGGKLYTEE